MVVGLVASGDPRTWTFAARLASRSFGGIDYFTNKGLGAGGEDVTVEGDLVDGGGILVVVTDDVVDGEALGAVDDAIVAFVADVVRAAIQNCVAFPGPEAQGKVRKL